MKILVLCGDYWHPAEVIRRGLKFLEGDYELDFVEDAKDILTNDFIRQYPIIINAKMDELSNGNQHAWFDEATETKVKDLVDYVEEGHGFISLHAGNSYFWDKNREYCEFNGSAFVNHPTRCDITVCANGNHPIVDGIADFVIRDEHYEMDHIADDAQILLKSSSVTGGNQIAGYVRDIGRGRLCSLIPGHILSVFDSEEYREIIRRAIKWCAFEL